jgi:hypothetical protein
MAISAEMHRRVDPCVSVDQRHERDSVCDFDLTW